MTTPEIENTQEQELPPIIPAWVLWAVVFIGFFLGLGDAIIQGQFQFFLTGVSWIISLIALLAWALMFPEQVLELVKGRSFAFGGTAIIMTAILIVAAGFVYTLIKQQAWRYDLSERDLFSLDQEVSDVLAKIADDPKIPPVTFIGLYAANNAADRDRFEVLFNDMVSVSNGKISYQFVDPNREIRFTEQYTDPDDPNARLRSGQIIVAVNDAETGAPSTERFELVFSNATAQFDLINAMLSLSAVGDFRAYFLSLSGGMDITATAATGASQFASDLEDDNWTVEQVSPLQISGDSPQFTLNDAAADAEIVLLAGGAEALDDASLAVLQDYAANGGDFVILGDINSQGALATAQAENMSNFLWETYGVRFRNDLVIDPDRAVGNLQTLVINTYGTHEIVTGLNSDDDWLVMEVPHSIEIAEPVPAGVTVTVLATTTEAGYAKADIDFSVDFTDADLTKADDDLTGEIAVAVAVENTNTGSRLVLFASDALLKNQYRQFREVVSPEVVTSSIIWASDAQNFADEILKINPEAPTQDAPVFVTANDLRWMTLIAVLLPFSALGLGVLIWWLQRNRMLD